MEPTAAGGVVVTEFAPPEALAVLGQVGPVHHDPALAGDPARLLAAASGADALVVRNMTHVDESLLAAAPTLKVVGRLGAGLDNIDLGACRRRGVTVVYSPFGNARSVAEHTMALALALARRLVPTHARTRRGLWERAPAAGMELAGGTWGILGYGQVGRFVAAAARGLGMDCITHHPRKPPDHPDLAVADVVWVPEWELFRRATVLSVHLPLRPDTRQFVDARRLALMPRDSLLVHTSRGGVVDETALVRALRRGNLAGAALDVREQEPPRRPDPLASMDNVILTPHVAGLTGRAQARVARQVAEDVVRVLSGREPLFPAP